ncbi:Smr/MutS family protein [Flavobacterium sp. N2270]|uniref:Smr/MutS family protein n=1 Tax=Flavobacterium sp. N2270 TaxID=2986831 RepID=UPI0022249BF8|nr:Smr/MutS family protein [Flavobacterium sp. N2270]
MQNLEIGDKVSVLDDDFDGVVVKVENTSITIETSDGFTMTYFVNELIKTNNINELNNVFSSKSLTSVLQDKTEEKKRSFVKEKKSKKDDFVLEVDLHIEKLVKNFRGLSNFEILNIQMDNAKGQLDFAIRKRMPRLVFIHGVGEGVLKSELEFLLSKYDGITFKEASYQKYGIGATEVYIKQNVDR